MSNLVPSRVPVQEDDASRPRGGPAAAGYTCPRCGGPAVPLSVTTHGPGKVLVRLRCDACPLEFDAERRTQTLFDKS
jgi:hypothetical protein